jgi:hypothetical protein
MDILQERIAHKGFTISGSYVNAHTKIEIKCPEGHTWEATPDHISQGQGCPHCSNTFPLTAEVINDRLADRKITMTGSYENTQVKSEFTCSVKHRWSATPNSVLRGTGCPHCSNIAPLTAEVINGRLQERGITMIGVFTTSHIKTEFTCSDGHIWSATPAPILRGGGCPTCAKTGFDPEKPATLYHITIERPGYNKIGMIGITNRTVEKRYKTEPKGFFTNVMIWENMSGSIIQDAEFLILNRFKSIKYDGESPLKGHKTNKEMFTRPLSIMEIETALFDVGADPQMIIRTHQ